MPSNITYAQDRHLKVIKIKTASSLTEITKLPELGLQHFPEQDGINIKCTQTNKQKQTELT